MQAQQTEELFKHSIETGDFATVERILIIEKFEIQSVYILNNALTSYINNADDEEQSRLKILTLLLRYAVEFNALHINHVLYGLILLNNRELIEIALSHPSINLGLIIDPDDYTFSGVHIAASLKDSRILSLFLARNAASHLLDNNRVSPLMVAAQSGCAENVKILLENNVDVMLKNDFGFCALGYALARNNNDPDKVAILKLLLAHGAAFCIEEPRLADIAPLMNHYAGCYFFETTIHGQSISTHMEHFEEATVFEFTEPEIKIDQTNIPHRALIARCAELLRNNRDLRSVMQLQRCLLFNEQNEHGNVLTLQSLCLQQLMRQQRNFQDLIPRQNHSLMNLVASHQSLCDLNICRQRIQQLTELIESSSLRNILPFISKMIPCIIVCMSFLPNDRPEYIILKILLGLLLLYLLTILSSIDCFSDVSPLRQLNDFSERVRQEDQMGEGLSFVVPFNDMNSLDNYVEYRETLISHERRLINTSSHGFFQRVFQNEPAQVAVEIVEIENDNLAQEDDILLQDYTRRDLTG